MSYVHIGLYNTLRSLGATEDQAQAAVADLPMPHHLASKAAERFNACVASTG